MYRVCSSWETHGGLFYKRVFFVCINLLSVIVSFIFFVVVSVS